MGHTNDELDNSLYSKCIIDLGMMPDDAKEYVKSANRIDAATAIVKTQLLNGSGCDEPAVKALCDYVVAAYPSAFAEAPKEHRLEAMLLGAVLLGVWHTRLSCQK